MANTVIYLATGLRISTGFHLSRTTNDSPSDYALQGMRFHTPLTRFSSANAPRLSKLLCHDLYPQDDVRRWSTATPTRPLAAAVRKRLTRFPPPAAPPKPLTHPTLPYKKPTTPENTGSSYTPHEKGLLRRQIDRPERAN
ncbi:hypothetical protein TcasGA2_TC000354 [Tribolium castaneum]|uniref:Uncharacterized protein n=1 Tax=Tribolium castaneum TaxID=7070 RepID=D6WAR4_TRICA|nr:hypothetical protein TcasGA2_TC000354 [Tribolium castaneum]